MLDGLQLLYQAAAIFAAGWNSLVRAVVVNDQAALGPSLPSPLASPVRPRTQYIYHQDSTAAGQRTAQRNALTARKHRHIERQIGFVIYTGRHHPDDAIALQPVHSTVISLS